MKDDDLIPEAARLDRNAILQLRLGELRRRHRELDEEIAALTGPARAGDMFSLQRLKKEKLSLRDQISVIEDQLTPDIIA